MAINFKELVDFACKGISAEIDKKEKTIRQGYELISQIESGEKVKTKMTAAQIREVIVNEKAEIEELCRKKFDYKWELAMRESEE